MGAAARPTDVALQFRRQHFHFTLGAAAKAAGRPGIEELADMERKAPADGANGERSGICV